MIGALVHPELTRRLGSQCPRLAYSVLLPWYHGAHSTYEPGQVPASPAHDCRSNRLPKVRAPFAATQSGSGLAVPKQAEHVGATSGAVNASTVHSLLRPEPYTVRTATAAGSRRRAERGVSVPLPVGLRHVGTEVGDACSCRVARVGQVPLSQKGTDKHDDDRDA